MALPDVPLIHPKDVAEAPPGLQDRVAQVSVDVRSTGLVYHADGSSNDESRAYRVSLVTSVLDIDNHPVPYDALDVRVVVPGYMTKAYDLTEEVASLSDIVYSHTNVSEKEKARLTAQQVLAGEPTGFPTTEVSIPDYDQENTDHGLSVRDAADVIKRYLLRWKGGCIMTGQNLRLQTEMLDRIGVRLDILETVYHRMIEMYAVFLTDTLAAQDIAELAGVPSMTEMNILGEGEEKDSLARARHISAYMAAKTGYGSAVSILDLSDTEMDFTAALDQEDVQTLTITNKGLASADVTVALNGDSAFGVTPTEFTLEGGAEIGVGVTYEPTTAGPHAGTLSVTGPSEITTTVELSGDA